METTVRNGRVGHLISTFLKHFIQMACHRDLANHIGSARLPLPPFALSTSLVLVPGRSEDYPRSYKSGHIRACACASLDQILS